MTVALALPIIAAILQSISYLLDKIILDKQKINSSAYLGLSFPMIFFINLAFLFGAGEKINADLFSGETVSLLIASAILIILGNIAYYRALQDDFLEELQIIDIAGRIPFVLGIAIFFTDERNFIFIALSILASISMLWSHLDHGKFEIKKKTLPFLAWSLFIPPFAASISKILLISWNPIALEVVRSGMVMLVLNPLFFNSAKSAKNLNLFSFSTIVLANILSTAAWILFYFSAKMSGFIYTGLIFSLQPMLTYFGSIILLKEPLNWKKTVAFAIIIAAIALSELIG